MECGATRHDTNTGHKLDFDNVVILDFELNEKMFFGMFSDKQIKQINEHPKRQEWHKWSLLLFTEFSLQT